MASGFDFLNKILKCSKNFYKDAKESTLSSSFLMNAYSDSIEMKHYVYKGAWGGSGCNSAWMLRA
jgi:hypothetical protein